MSEWIHLYTGTLIPGPVLGMLMITLWLLFFGIPETLEATSSLLLKYMALLFLPAGAGFFFLPSAILDQWVPLLGALIIGTCMSILLCALLLKVYFKLFKP
nr:CidA/LrgA family protein [Marinibactrum halimedae]